MLGDKYPIKFILPGIGEAQGELIRIKGPHLTEIIFRNLPLNSRGLKRDGLFIMPTSVLYAIEKPVINGKKGDICYDSKSKAIIILLAEKTFESKIANIGSITKNFKIFENLKMSIGVRIEAVEQINCRRFPKKKQSSPFGRPHNIFNTNSIAN